MFSKRIYFLLATLVLSYIGTLSRSENNDRFLISFEYGFKKHFIQQSMAPSSHSQRDHQKNFFVCLTVTLLISDV